MYNILFFFLNWLLLTNFNITTIYSHASLTSTKTCNLILKMDSISYRSDKISYSVVEIAVIYISWCFIVIVVISTTSSSLRITSHVKTTKILSKEMSSNAIRFFINYCCSARILLHMNVIGHLNWIWILK